MSQIYYFNIIKSEYSYLNDLTKISIYESYEATKVKTNQWYIVFLTVIFIMMKETINHKPVLSLFIFDK